MLHLLCRVSCTYLQTQPWATCCTGARQPAAEASMLLIVYPEFGLLSALLVPCRKKQGVCRCSCAAPLDRASAQDSC